MKGIWLPAVSGLLTVMAAVMLMAWSAPSGSATPAAPAHHGTVFTQSTFARAAYVTPASHR